MKTVRKRLSDDEIKHLGLNPNKTKRYRLSSSQLEDLQYYRESKSALLQECDANGIESEDVKHFWYKSKNISAFVKKQQATYEEIRYDIIASMEAHAPKYPKIKRKGCKDGHLLVIDPADVHIGKLASSFEASDDYNSNIAVERVRSGVKGILNKTAGFNIDKIVFIGGNDILHVDTPRNTTTSGTPQDTDGNWYSNFIIAKELYVEILESLIGLADVHFTFNPSNHDYMSGFFLADTIKSWFRNSSNITFDVSIAHRKYYQYGENLIGTTHGDGAKTTDLPLLMAQEAKKEWANTKHRYVYTHHVHHKTSKDFSGVTVESLRSPSGTDSWHHRNGYEHSPKAVEGFLHHKKHGQIARITHLF